MMPDKKLPLFIVSGASGVGKTSACEILFQKESRYIVMESDLLWRDFFDTPEDNYREFRETWMRVCASISQIGLPVVLCGCGLPEQFEECEARAYFSEVHYAAVVCEETSLRRRMREGRGISDETWLESSRHFNEWLKKQKILGMELAVDVLSDLSGKIFGYHGQKEDNQFSKNVVLFFENSFVIMCLSLN